MALTADHLVVIGHGQILADCSSSEFIDRHSEQTVLVRSPDSTKLREVLGTEGGRIVDGTDSTFTVLDMPAPRIGELAAHHGFVLHELTPQRGSLEDAFMELTRDSVEYAAASTPEPTVAAAAPAEPRGDVR
jgi:ABC-2 type transport system ATP-binding protein